MAQPRHVCSRCRRERYESRMVPRTTDALPGQTMWVCAARTSCNAARKAANRADRVAGREVHATMERMAELLDGVANALNGPAPELVSWSWHDLPEKAAALKAQLDALEERIRSAARLAQSSGVKSCNVLHADELLVLLEDAKRKAVHDG